MRQHGLQPLNRTGNPHGPKAHDGTITTERTDVMSGTDLTTTLTRDEDTAHVFVAVSHCTRECIGLDTSKWGGRFEALEPLRQGVCEHFGGFAPGIAARLSIRHDHGSAYLSREFQRELQFLGMVSSPSYVRDPVGNGCAERLIRTLKNVWPRPCTLSARCRGRYNGRRGRLPLGSVGTRPLVPEPPPAPRRIAIMPGRAPAHVPPRA